MLRLAIPNGSLEEGTFRLFEQASLPIKRKGARDYRLSIDDPRIEEVFPLRPREVAEYISEGEFDLGITGFDWIVETKANVKEVLDLQFSRGGFRKVKIVLATDKSNPVSDVNDISVEDKVATEYPNITQNYFSTIGKGRIKKRVSFGATEIKVPRLAKYLVDVTETGETLRQNSKKILATIMESSTKLIVNPESWKDEKKRREIEEVKSLIAGALNARDKILIKMNVPADSVEVVVNYLPTMRAPTVSQLAKRNADSQDWFALESVVEASCLNVIIPNLKRLGAVDILEINISKMIP
ncbi:MAG: ATP phosphoribosyltransferase [bacterium]|nr:ATP phosphoribosyltransferase [Patescibacteria group bacterium]